MKVNRQTAAAFFVASLGSTMTSAFTSVPKPCNPSAYSALRMSSNPFPFQEDTTVPPQKEVAEAPPRPQVQPIQPGMQEAPLYELPPSNDENSGIRVVNGRQVVAETSNLRLDNNQFNYQGPGEQSQRIQGSSLRTYDNIAMPGGSPMSTEVHLSTQGRPIHADLQIWAGPNNTPQSVKLYSQDGSQYGVSTIFHGRSASNNNNNNGRSGPQANSVSIRNEATMEFPVTAQVSAAPFSSTSSTFAESSTTGQSMQQQQPQGMQYQSYSPRVIEYEGGVLLQGEGMVRTFPIAANVQSVQVILQSSSSSQGNRRLPIMATVELLQGPNNVKTKAEIYDDGLHGDYFETIMDTPGFSSSIRITNTGPMTYPFHVLVVPYTFGQPKPLNSNELASGVARSRFGPDGQFRG